MPVPSSAELMGFVDASDLPPNHQVPFSRALADPIVEAMTTYAAVTTALPGIPTSVVPPTMTGVTTAPGNLLAVPLPTQQHKLTVARFTRTIGLDRPQKETLDTIMAEALTKGFEAVSGAMVTPGIPIAGGVTAGPGQLQAPLVSILAATLPGQLSRWDPRAWIPPAPVRGRPGVLGPCLPKKPSNTVGRLIANSMRLFVERMMIAPGIPAPGPVTAGPGLLI